MAIKFEEIGTKCKVMRFAAELVDQKVIDGTAYQLWKAENSDAGIVRIVDLDASEVFGMKAFPKFEIAEAAHKENYLHV